ncbi:retrovirus-related Pol polyprotein from transposon opus [Maylandia zebra]|uniref:retrovirus-related Pol polyprotein from transposon opus n=1 Tax=Maylandia zebra TaxID=106582 RepID=UPI00403CE692
MTITFPKDFIGVPVDVNTLALIVPDTSQSLMLIGTNTLDVLFDIYSETDLANRQPLPHGYKVVFKIIELRRKQTSDTHQGVVKLLGKMPQVIPAGSTVVVEGVALGEGLQDEKSVVIEYPSSSPLPGGLLLKAGLVDFPQRRPHKLPVVISNESDHDIVIPAKCTIAEVSAYQTILLKEHNKTKQSELSQRTPETPSFQEPTITFNFGDSPVPLEWKQRITQQLSGMPEVFAQHDLDFGRTDQVRHHIKLSDGTPFKLRARPIHPRDIEAVRKHIQELLDAGVIRESESPFASPIVVVRKKNGQVRLCIDYRRLNLQTIKDAYSLPKLEDTFSALNGSQWFSVLDLKSGYYQIEVEEADKPKTAFVCPLGFWEFNRMPQGVTNAPSTFQRLMERCMGDMHLKDALVFLDDVIVFSRTLEEHEERLMKVLTRLKEFGLKLSPEKCVFFQTSVRYLGHVVSRNGVRTDPEKISALKTWPVPQTLRELKSFLGFAGYYRRFVKGYSSIVKPLHNLTSGYPPSHKKSKVNARQSAHQYHDPKDPFGGRWTPACQEAFESVIQSLTTAPVLAFADPQKPYILHTDASTTGLGAVLYQEQEGQLRVIGYASRGLSRSENRYPAHKLEFLALKWSVTEKFSDYLYGNHFTVVTDSNPLTYILTSAKLDATSYRWLAALSTFSFKLLYRPGKQNGDADGLSRRPHGGLADDLKSQKEIERIQQFTQDHLCDPDNINAVNQSVVKAICERQFTYSVSPDNEREADADCVALVEVLAVSPSAVPDSYGQEEQFGGLPTIPHLTEAELADEQRADQCIKHVISQIEYGDTPPPTVRTQLPELPLLLRELNRLELRNNVLYRRRQERSQKTYQLVLPAELRNTVLTSLHDHMGHMGVDRTLDLVRSRFYWPRMALDVERKVKTCGRCVRRKARPERAAPLVNINTTRPLELLCMDFLSLEADRSGTKDILVITDHFTKFAVAIPTPNQKARTVARCLWENFMVHYGIPEKLHSDQGPDFESRTIKELCQVAGIHKVRTTPYHPRGNPVERFNRTLLDMLGTLRDQDKSCWRDHVRPLVHAYNCTRNEVTGFSPYELMFGRQPRLPVDLAFNLPVQEEQHSSHSEYVQKLKSRLKESYKLAMDKAAKMAHKNKMRFDRHVTASDLEAGDRVLVRNVRIRGKHKISDKWEHTVHVVVRRAGNLPVYTVKPENKDGPLRTLHRDLLLPCGYLPVEESSEHVQKPVSRRPRTRANPALEEENSSDEEDDLLIPVWLSSPVHTVSESPVNVPDIDNPPVFDSQSDFGNIPDMPNSTTDDTEYLSTNGVTPTEQVDEITLTETDSPVDDPDVQERQLPFQEAGTRGANSEERVEEIVPVDTRENMDTNDSVRRSERNRRPPRRLDYTELGNPLITAAKSFLQGLSSAWADVISDGEEPASPSSLTRQIIII